MTRYRKPYGTPKTRLGVYLENAQLLKKMCGEMNYSAFVDELIAREHRRREKKVTLPSNKSSLTA